MEHPLLDYKVNGEPVALCCLCAEQEELTLDQAIGLSEDVNQCCKNCGSAGGSVTTEWLGAVLNTLGAGAEHQSSECFWASVAQYTGTARILNESPELTALAPFVQSWLHTVAHYAFVHGYMIGKKEAQRERP